MKKRFYKQSEDEGPRRFRRIQLVAFLMAILLLAQTIAPAHAAFAASDSSDSAAPIASSSAPPALPSLSDFRDTSHSEAQEPFSPSVPSVSSLENTGNAADQDPQSAPEAGTAPEQPSSEAFSETSEDTGETAAESRTSGPLETLTTRMWEDGVLLPMQTRTLNETTVHIGVEYHLVSSDASDFPVIEWLYKLYVEPKPATDDSADAPVVFPALSNAFLTYTDSTLGHPLISGVDGGADTHEISDLPETTAAAELPFYAQYENVSPDANGVSMSLVSTPVTAWAAMPERGTDSAAAQTAPADPLSRRDLSEAYVLEAFTRIGESAFAMHLILGADGQPLLPKDADLSENEAALEAAKSALRTDEPASAADRAEAAETVSSSAPLALYLNGEDQGKSLEAESIRQVLVHDGGTLPETSLALNMYLFLPPESPAGEDMPEALGFVQVSSLLLPDEADTGETAHFTLDAGALVLLEPAPEPQPTVRRAAAPDAPLRAPEKGANLAGQDLVVPMSDQPQAAKVTISILNPYTDGTYTFPTGQSVSAKINFGNDDGSLQEGTMRVFIRLAEAYKEKSTTHPDFNGVSLPVLSFEYKNADGTDSKIQAPMKRVQDSDLYYFDFTGLPKGSTATALLGMNYKNETSGGGRITLWAEPLSESLSEPSVTQEPTGNYIGVDVVIDQPQYNMVKKQVGDDATIVRQEDGKYYLDSIKWVIEDLTAAPPKYPDGYGENPIESTRIDDHLQLDDKVHLNERFITAINNQLFVPYYYPAPESNDLPETYRLSSVRVNEYGEKVEKVVVYDTAVDDPWGGECFFFYTDKNGDIFRPTESNKGNIQKRYFAFAQGGLLYTILNGTLFSLGIRFDAAKNTLNFSKKGDQIFNPHLDTQIKLGSEMLYLDSIDDLDQAHVTNLATRTLNYRYNALQIVEATCESTFSLPSTSLKIDKSVSWERIFQKNGKLPSLNKSNVRFDYDYRPQFYYGETIPFDLELRNVGSLPYGNLASYADNLSPELYLTDAQIAEIFKQKHGEYLTLTIRNAVFTPKTNLTLKNIEGSDIGPADAQYYGSGTTYFTAGESDPAENLTTTGVIKLRYDIARKCYVASFYRAETDSSPFQTRLLSVSRENLDPESLRDAFANIAFESGKPAYSFIITNGTKYDLEWNLPEGMELAPFESVSLQVDATWKNTFMLQGRDFPIWAEDEKKTGVNQLRATYREPVENEEFIAVSANPEQAKRDYRVSKELLERDQNIFQYRVGFSHAGNGLDTNLPLVDYMVGNRLLIAKDDLTEIQRQELEENVPHLTYKGQDYYQLNKPGEYFLPVGTAEDETRTQANITVTEDATTVRWVYPLISGTESKSITYYAAPDEGAVGTYGNIVYLNDHESHRIHDSVRGTIILKEKKIVAAEDALPSSYIVSEGDHIDGDDFSLIRRGEAITYRIRLESTNGSNFLKASDIYDELPRGIVWTSEGGAPNVSVRYATEPGKDIQWNPNATWLLQKNTKDVYELRWKTENDGDPLVSFASSGVAYIYVTLQYPGDSDNDDPSTGDNSTWYAFSSEYANTILENVAYVYQEREAVRHSVDRAQQVFFEKSLSQVDRFSSNDISRLAQENYIFKNNSMDIIWYESPRNLTRDDVVRKIIEEEKKELPSIFVQTKIPYTITVYNPDVRNLYLASIKDKLPEGTLFFGMYGHESSQEPLVADSYHQTGFPLQEWRHGAWYIKDSLGQRQYPRFVDYTITPKPDDTLRNITFDIELDADHYSESYGCYYLKPKEAIVFTYYAIAEDYNATEDVITNVAEMPIVPDGSREQPLIMNTLKTDTSPTTNSGTSIYHHNGTHELATLEDAVISHEKAHEAYGVNYVARSRVDATRFSKLGITKKLIFPKSNMILPNDSLRWEVKIPVVGGFPNLVITDYLDPQYTLQKLELTISSKPEDKKEFTFDKLGDGRYLVTDRSYGFIGRKELDVNRDNTYEWTYKLGYGVNPFIKARLMLTEQDDTLVVRVIIENTFALIEYNREYPTISLQIQAEPTNGAVRYGTYYNTARVSTSADIDENNPIAGIGEPGNGVPGDDKQYNSVWAQASVNVLGNYASQAKKQVVELEKDEQGALQETTKIGSGAPNDPDPKAPYPNAILLAGKDSVFRYKTEVQNLHEYKGIDSFVMIDNLPEVGDHDTIVERLGRNSEFAVHFANAPNYTLMIADKDGMVSDFPSSAYTIEYSTKTSFSDADWAGHSDTETQNNADWVIWNSGDQVPATARSVRITAKDTFEQFPTIGPNAKILFSFDAVVDESARLSAQKQYAWNSFGYAYSVFNDDVVLRAAPMKVGVTLPAEPSLIKELVNEKGETTTAPQDMHVWFLVHEGPMLPINTPQDYPTLQTVDAYKERFVKDPAHAGMSTPQEIRMGIRKGTSSISFPLSLLPIIIDRNKTYTILELAEYTTVDGTAAFIIDHGKGLKTTFTSAELNSMTRMVTDEKGITYPAVQLTPEDWNADTATLRFTNRLSSWGIDLYKVDADKGWDSQGYYTPLAGAIFGLYTPDPLDALSDSEIASLQMEQALDTLLQENKTYMDGDKAYYLQSVSFGNPDGESVNPDGDAYSGMDLTGKEATGIAKATNAFAGLDENEYFVRELRAPTGFALYSEAISVKRETAEDTVAGYNGVPVSLNLMLFLPVTPSETKPDISTRWVVVGNLPGAYPDTGGLGTLRFLLTGLSITAGSGLLYVWNRRRRRHAPEIS
ncbi:MAG: hypothetical protein SOW48_00550 [Peptoniphilaceae bacterium]|nr:hypothetical protein [Peptoniphilaceae bacterium]MDY3075142.1 hypothetical protein [Peptoniphilaceae bacterium]